MSGLITCPTCKSEFELSDAMRDSVAAEARKQAAVEIDRIRADAAKQAETLAKQRDTELELARKKVTEGQQKEADLLRRERELADKTAGQDLEFEQRLSKKAEEIQADISKAADARLARELAAKDAELVTARANAASAKQKEADLLRRERELAEKADAQGLEFEKQIALKTSQIRDAEKKAADERLARELADRLQAKDAELDAAKKKAAEAGQKEIELLRRERELTEKAGEQELELERRLSEKLKATSERLEATNRERAALELEKQQLRDKEHEEQKRQLQKTIEELHQRVQQGSTQIQGEAQEVALSKLLADAFRDDAVEDVPKGVNGADLLQRVFSQDRKACGTIIWESKRTQNWSDGWLQKLRDDKRASGAACAIIVTQALPAHIRGFGEIDGVWICSWAHAIPVATIVRAWLAEVAAANLTVEGSESKGLRLYAYLTGQEFRNRFEGIVEAYVEMRQDIDRERRSLLGMWKKRERQLDRALSNLSAFHGDLRGISGASFEELKSFALPGLTDGEPDDGDDEPAPPPLSVDTRLVELFFELVPADASAIGNVTLYERLGDVARVKLGVAVSEAEYESAKASLVASGRIRKGKGRGGSVARLPSTP